MIYGGNIPFSLIEPFCFILSLSTHYIDRIRSVSRFYLICIGDILSLVDLVEYYWIQEKPSTLAPRLQATFLFKLIYLS